MNFRDRINWFWTDKRKRVLLLLAGALALVLAVAMAVPRQVEQTVPVLMATGDIAWGEALDAENTAQILLAGNVVQQAGYPTVPEGLFAGKAIRKGQLVLHGDVGDAQAISAQRDGLRLVTLRLDMTTADAWSCTPGGTVELVHWDPDQLNPLRILEDITVVRTVRVNERDLYPSYAVLSMTAAQRDYVLCNRVRGRFELSQ